MSNSPRWQVRDAVAGAFLFVASAAFTLWQNSRVAALWDLSYLLDNAWRFSLGQIPYEQLPFAHAPLTFLLHAGIIRIFGRVYYPHIVCAAIECGLATLLTWRITVRVVSASPFGRRVPALLLISPLIFLGIYGIYPHPIYDSDCILAVLLSIYLLLRSENNRSTLIAALAGATSVIPIFFKQNIGLLFFVLALLAAATTAVVSKSQRHSVATRLGFLAGAAAAALCAATLIHFTVGIQNYRYWTITFASERRLPGLPQVLSSYRQTSLLWTVPSALAGVFLASSSRRSRRVGGFVLLAGPFVWAVIAVFQSRNAEDRADQLLSVWPHLLLLGIVFAFLNLRPAALKQNPAAVAVLPILLLGTIHGTFLSQELWGSTYAIWPLLFILIAMMLTQVSAVARPLALTIFATLLISGAFYAVSLDRLSYIYLDGPEHASTLPELHHMATPGPWLLEFEELVRYAKANIPAQDGVLLVPGEDPFFFATGRTPQFPILLFDPATDPYSPQQTVEEARSHNIRWLILKRNLQLNDPPYAQLPKIEEALQRDFAPYAKLTDYDIYRRR